MFFGATFFNENVGDWDVSSGTTLSGMFYNCTVFNNGGSSDINNWVKDKLTDISCFCDFPYTFNNGRFRQIRKLQKNSISNTRKKMI